MNKVGVQKLFWDAFELALSTQTKRLARDIADAVGQDAKALLAALQTEKTEVYLFEESNSEDIEFLEMRCKHYTPIPGKPHYVAKCMEPVVWSANPGGRVSSCLHHSLYPQPLKKSWTILNPIVYDDVEYYIDPIEGHVYTADGDLCGRKQAERLFLFETGPTEE